MNSDNNYNITTVYSAYDSDKLNSTVNFNFV